MKNKNLIIVIVILVLAVGVLAYLNQSIIANKNQQSNNPSILIKFKGDEISSINLNKIKSLGEEEFEKTLKSSGKPPRDHIYKGVALYKVINAVDETLLQKGEQVIAKAIDGYTVAYSAEEVMENEHIYIVYEQGGKPLGTKKDGGSGPLMIVARKDEFGQRWCKFVVEVNVQ